MELNFQRSNTWQSLLQCPMQRCRFPEMWYVFFCQIVQLTIWFAMIWRVFFFFISGQLGRCSQRSLYASPYLNPYEYGFASQIQKKIPIGQLYPSLFSTIDNKEQFEVLIHTVSSQNFRSFCFLPFLCHFTCQKIVQLNFFREIATYTSRLLSFDKGDQQSEIFKALKMRASYSFWDRILKISG